MPQQRTNLAKRQYQGRNLAHHPLVGTVDQVAASQQGHPQKPWAMLLALSLAVLLAMGLARGESNAAFGLQESPLSPLNQESVLPSPTATATPTPTSPLPPTNTPPALYNWVTPTPVGAAQIDASITFVAQEAEISADEFTLFQQREIIDPRREAVTASGDETGTLVVLQDGENQLYWTLVQDDADGELTVDFLPDFSDEASSLLAEREGIPVANIALQQSSYILFTFSQQVFWLGRFDAPDAQNSVLLLDLAGEAVDGDEVQAVETSVQESLCGVIQINFCLELLSNQPDRRYAAQFMAPEFTPTPTATDADDAIAEASTPDETTPVTSTPVASTPMPSPSPTPDDGLTRAERVEAYLAETNLSASSEEGRYRGFFPAENLLEIGTIGLSDWIIPTRLDQVIRLESNLLVEIAEDADGLALRLTTERVYPYTGARVDAAITAQPLTTQSLTAQPLTTTMPMTQTITVAGLFQPGERGMGQAPAQAVLPLGNLPPGQYTIEIRHTDPVGEVELIDRYVLLLADTRLVLRPQAQALSWPQYNGWLRLPQDAVWYVTTAITPALSTEVAPELAALPADEGFSAYAQGFFDQISALGLTPLELPLGVYTHVDFVPPWETWQREENNGTVIPARPGLSYVFQRPHIQYFAGYPADITELPEALEELYARYCEEASIAITQYSAQGERRVICGDEGR